MPRGDRSQEAVKPEDRNLPVRCFSERDISIFPAPDIHDRFADGVLRLPSPPWPQDAHYGHRHRTGNADERGKEEVLCQVSRESSPVR